MALPKILDIARDYSLVIFEKTVNSKEVMCKCPFCLEDSNKDNKHYLSLNTESNVFKCWFCKESGGVLHFISKLSGRPYEEIKRQYVKNRKNYHPSESLNNSQLHLIGWDNKKTKEDFHKAKNDLWEKWQQYEYETLAELFAEFLYIQQLEYSERQKTLFEYLEKRCKESKIEQAMNRLLHESKLDDVHRQAWANEGRMIASIAWDSGIHTNTVLEQIPFVSFLYRKRFTNRAN